MRHLQVIGGAVSAALLGLIPTAASAGSPHFVNNEFSESCTNDSLTVTGKEAGLGDEEQIHVALTASAVCINPGQKHPKADNKVGASSQADVPVQNGKAEYTLTAVVDIQPNCSPPMTILWTDVTLTDTTNNLVKSFPNCTPAQ